MKKTGTILMLILLLTGCGKDNSELDRAMALRSNLLKSGGTSFKVDITADYGDKLNLFAMDCQADAQGNIRFSVTAPESIAGITGTIAEGTGQLTFDNTALYFDLLTDEQLSPVSAPWILMKTLRSGYLTSVGMEEDILRLTIDDSYEDNALQLDIWLDDIDIPQRAEVLYDGKNILSMVVKEFQIL